jgi:hypothetical protein
LRIMAGTDVAAPLVAVIRPEGDPIQELLEPLYDLFELHKEAQANYRARSPMWFGVRVAVSAALAIRWRHRHAGGSAPRLSRPRTGVI